jgi:hypothetical protein
VTPAGVNFGVFSKRATGIELMLFDAPPSRVVRLEPCARRTYY